MTINRLQKTTKIHRKSGQQMSSKADQMSSEPEEARADSPCDSHLPYVAFGVQTAKGFSDIIKVERKTLGVCLSQGLVRVVRLCSVSAKIAQRNMDKFWNNCFLCFYCHVVGDILEQTPQSSGNFPILIT